MFLVDKHFKPKKASLKENLDLFLLVGLLLVGLPKSLVKLYKLHNSG